MSDAVTPISEPGLKGDVTTVELDRLERAVARRSAEARATIPTMEFSTVVDVDRLLERDAELGCGVTAIVVAAAASALRTVPRVNGSYRDGRYELYSTGQRRRDDRRRGDLRDAHDLRRRREVSRRDRKRTRRVPAACARGRAAAGRAHRSDLRRSSTRALTTSSRSRRWCCRPRPGRWRSGRSVMCRSCAAARSSPAAQCSCPCPLITGSCTATTPPRSWRKSRRFWRRHAYDRHRAGRRDARAEDRGTWA